MRYVFPTMGTMVSLEFSHALEAQAACTEVERVFTELDGRFSLYRADSELSLIASGVLPLMEASDDVREIYATALMWRERTNGWFTPHRPDGVIDLNGIVKAIALERAALALESAPFAQWCLNAGGDVLAAGSQGDGTPWVIGIVDPLERDRLVCSVALRVGRRAVATSGSAERGDHIWRATRPTSVPYKQATVVADDIVTADICATAIIAGGERARDEITGRFDVDVLTVDRDGALTASPGFRASLAA